LRGSLSSEPIASAGFDLAMVFALGLAALILASALLTRILRRAQQTGELALR
jgi:hypothetical protein